MGQIKKLLNNIFAKKAVVETATVNYRISATEMEVETLTGIIKKVAVTKGEFYPRGVMVLVENGIITGNAGVLAKVKKVMV